jgi:hypothetical protein
MIKTILGSIAMTLFVSGAAFADSVTFGAHVGDNDQRYYDLSLSHSVAGTKFVVSGLAETEQADTNALLSQKYSASLGYKLDAPMGISVVPSVEYGVKLLPGTNDESFYGAGISVGHKVWGPVSASVAYRYRTNFSGTTTSENRESASLDWAVTPKQTLGLTAHTYSGANTSLGHVYGVSYKYSF